MESYKNSQPFSKIAVIHGRFQPLHSGHLEYLLAGCAHCDKIIIGISNPDPWTTAVEISDVGRSDAAANPCTYYERALMIEGALLDNGVDRRAFRIVPFPHSFPERLQFYTPRDALYLLSIYDRWGEVKLQRFKNLGLRTHVLWRRDRKVTTGTEIRRRIAAGQTIDHLVPPATAAIIREFGIDRRIRDGIAAPAVTAADGLAAVQPS